MKKKVLFSIVGIALFAMAIGFSLNNQKENSLKLKNTEALAIVNPPGDGGSIPCNWACTMYVHDECVLCGSTCDVYSYASDEPENFWCSRP